MKLASILALALPALVAATASVNIRGTSFRGLAGSSDKEPVSGGKWLYYLMLNTVMSVVDMSAHGCNSPQLDNNKRLLENAASWQPDGYTDNSQSSSNGSGSSHTSSASSSKPKPKRCDVVHAPALVKHKPPKKNSSSTSHSTSSTYNNQDQASGSNGWSDDGHISNAADNDTADSSTSASGWGRDGYQSSQMAYNDGSGGGGAVVGVSMSLMVAAVAAALVAKKVSLYTTNLISLIICTTDCSHLILFLFYCY